jgi:hypothetical protein
MSDPREPHSLEQVVSRIEDAEEGNERVTMRQILHSLGSRSFAPLMLVPALVVISPVGGILGVPTAMAAVIALVATQLLAGRHSVWLPEFVLSKSVRRERLDKIAGFTNRAASYVDLLLARRLTVLVETPFDHVIAVLILVLCLTVPPLEALPFANAVSGAIIAAFSLALLAQDGLLAIIAAIATAAMVWFALSLPFI